MSNSFKIILIGFVGISFGYIGASILSNTFNVFEFERPDKAFMLIVSGFSILFTMINLWSWWDKEV